jgi:translocation and assembly module TamB
MSVTTKPTHNSLYHLKKVLRLFAKVIIALLLLVIVIFILVQTPPVQNFARKKIENFLEKKLKTEVNIGKLYIGFPNTVSLQNVYVEDLQKDTLLYGGKLAVDISLFKLISNELEINEIQFENITAKIKRQLPDTTFNFQFIIDAFAPANAKKTTTADTAAMKMAIKSVLLNKVRVLYKDVITGNDMDIWINDFTTRIDVFDPATMTYDVPDIHVNGIKARIYQTKPLTTDKPMAEHMAEAAAPIMLNLNFKDIVLEDIDLDYRNDVSSVYYATKLGRLEVEASKLDLPNRILELNKIHLNQTTAAIRLGNKPQAQVVKEAVEQTVVSQAQTGWRIKVADLELNDNNIKFDNDAMPRTNNGMDYAHIKADKLTFHASDLLYTLDSVSARITKGTFTEKSGFRLNRLETNFLFASKEAYLDDLIIETPGTRISRSVVLRYPSLDALAKNPASLRLDIDLDNSRVQVKDILTFAPQLRGQPAFANVNDVWLINGEVDGTLANLNIHPLQFRGLSNTRVDVSGTISGLPDVNKTRANLNIRNLTTNKTDLSLFIPKGALPQNITLPDAISVNGTVNGGMQDVTTNLNINTNLGTATVKGRIQQATDPKAARYALNISTRSLQVGRIIQNPDMVGAISADFTANGRGFDPTVAQGTVNGTIHSAVIKNYTYRNFKIDGSIADKEFRAKAGIKDPNIHLSIDASGLLSDNGFPSLKMDAVIDSIKTQPLNLTKNLVVYRGNIKADFANIDPDNLMGNLLVTHSVIVNDQQRIQLDTLSVDAGRGDTGRFLRLTSDIAYVAIEGEYKLTELGTVIQNSIQPHFALVPNYQVTQVAPYNFSVNASILDRPLLRSFMPDLKQVRNLVINGSFNNNDWFLNVNSPFIEYGPNKIDNLNLRAGSGNGGIAISTTVDHLVGAGLNVYGVNVNATAANNQVNLDLNVKDKSSKDKYRLSATLNQPTFGNYTVSLQPQNLLLNYDNWTIPQNNSIVIAPEGFNVNNFILSQGNQRLSINSASSAINAPINVNFSSFKLGTITGFVQADTTMVDGTMNGTVVLNNVMTQPTFTSDLTVSDVSVMKDTLGNVTIKVNNTVPNTFDADVRLTGRGNDVALTGKYFMKPGNQSSYDLLLDIRALQLSTLEGLSQGAVTDATGTLGGRVTINGTMADPNINGNVLFNKAAVRIAMLNSKFTIDEERVVVIDNQGIRLSTFTIKDELGNAIVIDGNVATTNYMNYRFNLDVNARNFRASNTTKKDNKLFYGKLFFNTNLRIRGTELLPVVDGSLTVNKETDFTVVLPQADPGVVSREGIIEFVDMDAPKGYDSVFMPNAYAVLDSSTIKGFDVTTNIEINKEATLNLVVDAGNGDFISMKGEGLLTGGIDKSGKITLTGSYELEEGSYELTFNFLRRKFNIQKGSKIVWQGDPTDAVLDVTAVYIANTSPLDLVDDQLADATTTIRNTYLQKLPFEVRLRMQGELLKPLITFDIVLPERNYNVSNDIVQNVEVKLDQLRQQPSELNKQVFALLLLNRFVGENPFASSGSSPFDAGAFARQSASKLLTEQLNRLAENLIQGVDINFDVTSVDDYTTGERRNRSDFNVSLSKNLLSERLRVTVGTNFELEGPQQSQQNSGIADNVALDYKLSKDGRYMLRAYRRNEYEGVVDGYVIETGLSFILTMDYNRFMEIFRKRRPRNQRRNEQQRNEQTAPTTTTPIEKSEEPLNPGN